MWGDASTIGDGERWRREGRGTREPRRHALWRVGQSWESVSAATNVIDAIHSLAFSIQSNPGVYAVLIGSGVSKAAAVPTGWDVTIDLVRKLAAVRNETPEPDPESWFRNTFGTQPDDDTFQSVQSTFREICRVTRIGADDGQFREWHRRAVSTSPSGARLETQGIQECRYLVDLRLVQVTDQLELVANRCHSAEEFMARERVHRM